MPKFLISSGLPSYPPALNDSDAAKLAPLYRAISTLANRVSELTGQVQYSQFEYANLDKLLQLRDQTYTVVVVKATETIAYGKLVTIIAGGTDLEASLATNADELKPAHGICDVPGGIAAGTYGPVVFMHGRCAGVSGSVFGAQYWLSTAGTLQLEKPVAGGAIKLVQAVALGMGGAGVYLNIPNLGV